MASSTDTIFALASGALPAGIAVIRLSGPGCRFVLETMAGGCPPARHASLRSLRGPAGEVLDQGLVLWLPGPASYSGEDMVELHCHGGRAVVAAVLRRLGAFPGLRPAEPGEFTRRAFLAGRMDLTEIEGLADLIGAETEAQRRQAIRQAGGSLRRLYDGWRERIVRARALVEAELDFADEADVPGSVSDAAFADMAALADAIARHLDDGGRGERLRRGFEVVLMGPPNAGKSSLLNALCRRDAAIVTAEPGTTRDLIEVAMDLGGYPVTLVDAAGLRETDGLVEREGIRRALQRARSADLVLWLTPAGDAAEAVPESLAGLRVLPVTTKIDTVGPPGRAEPAGIDEGHGSGVALVGRGGQGATEDPAAFASATGRGAGDAPLAISALRGDGLSVLEGVLSGLAAEGLGAGDEPVLTRARHRSALGDALDGLRRALAEGLELELRAEELRRAGDAIGRITGRVDVEDLLDVIFRQFCIGK